jgi:uncharacterized membrane protein YdfJ with MMPL/SSD domain
MEGAGPGHRQHVGSAATLIVPVREEATRASVPGWSGAFAGTGWVVTIAGIVFGIIGFAMAGSNVPTTARLGTTIGVGLLPDTLVVHTSLMPSAGDVAGPLVLVADPGHRTAGTVTVRATGISGSRHAMPNGEG